MVSCERGDDEAIRGPWTPMTSPMLSNIPHLYVNSASVKNTLPPKQQKFFNRGGISNLFFQSLC